MNNGDNVIPLPGCKRRATIRGRRRDDNPVKLTSAYYAKLERNAYFSRFIHWATMDVRSAQGTDASVWAVARQPFGKIGITDCVVYLRTRDGLSLRQKAAYGPKVGPDEQVINPMTIALGEGIVGNVAATGAAEMVGDTSQDERYIVDDAVRLSELAVPIRLRDGSIAGVIDSEHEESNYFDFDHRHVLDMIALVLALKLDFELVDQR